MVTTMPITRYGLGREYAGNTGSPAITEQADGAYVRYEDHAAIIGEAQAEKAALESIVAAQAGVIAKNGRLLIACEAHNEMLLGRLRLAEGAQPGVPFSIPAGYSVKRVEGHGWIFYPPSGYHWTAYERSPIGDLFNALLAPTPPARGQTQHSGEGFERDHKKAVRAVIVTEIPEIQGLSPENAISTLAHMLGVVQQDAEKVDTQPVAWRHSLTHCLYDRREDVPLADGDEWPEPLYLDAQPAPAMAGDAALLDMLETLCNGLEWNIENHPEVMNESDAEALAQARALLKRVQPASGEDKPCA